MRARTHTTRTQYTHMYAHIRMYMHTCINTVQPLLIVINKKVVYKEHFTYIHISSGSYLAISLVHAQDA